VSLRRFASLAGALLVAAIAALASYTHMRTVALYYGQPPLIADLLPGSVDGLMATATVALGDGRRNRWSAWLAFWTGVSASVLANVLAAEPSLPARCISAWPAVAFVLVVEVITRGLPAQPTPDSAPSISSAAPVAGGHQRTRRAQVGPGESSAAPGPGSGPKKRAGGGTGLATARTRRPIGQTRELAARVRSQNPQISQAELARQLGISATRVRQIDQGEVRLELPPETRNGDVLMRGEPSP
jgi:hypothetical protein